MLELHFLLAIEHLEVIMGSRENGGNWYVTTWRVAITCCAHVFLHSGIMVENEDN